MKISFTDLKVIFYNKQLNDLLPIIYEKYITLLYEKHNVWHLMDLLDSLDIPISCKLNKKSIIKFIENNRFNILHPAISQTLWSLSKITYIDYRNDEGSKIVSKNIICLHNLTTRTEISQNDVYNIGGVSYMIDYIYDNDTVELVNINSTVLERKTMSITEFLKLMEKDDSIVEVNQLRDNRLKYDWRIC